MSLKRRLPFTDDFFSLFVKREWPVILGRKWTNLWLLTGMLTAAFLAIAFSNASMHYLSDKMNDPFIKWVDIKNSFGEGDFSGLENALNDPENKETYDYSTYQADYYHSFMICGAEPNSLQYLQCRFFEDFQTPLVEEILDKGNVVDDCVISDLYSLPEEFIGIVITEKALNKLGYKKAPAYIDFLEYCDNVDSLGFEIYEGRFAHVPLPVLGVVKRLPSNVDIISTKFFFVQDYNGDTHPFNLCANPSYAESLHYFVPDDANMDEFVETLEKIGKSISSVDCSIDEYSFYKPEILPYISGNFVSLVGDYNMPLNPIEAAQINKDVLAECGQKGIFRVYDYNFSPSDVTEKSYLSVTFNSLDKIKDFETFVSGYNVKIDMSQINSKDNYNAVSIMANILSWAIIVFAMICIILFLVNLLKSYFQKIKRNLGTFKAFGVSNKRLASVYCLIVASTVAGSVLISLSVAAMLQLAFRLTGILKEGMYNYLELGSFKTLVAAVIITSASVYTVYQVISKLLKHTPGDLIYDR